MADYTPVSGRSISSDVQSNLTAALETITDPTGARRQFVYQSDPRRKSGSFEDYPYIYIEDYSSTKTEDTVNDFVQRYIVEAEIVLEATDDSAKAKDQFDSITDEILYAFNTGLAPTLAENGISVSGDEFGVVENNRFTGIEEADEPIIRREMTIRMKMHLDMGNA